MGRSEYRRILLGLGLLAASLLLVELIGFRLLTAVFGAWWALFFALTAPAVAALGARTVGTRKPSLSSATLTAGAASWVAWTAIAWMAALIGLTWVSQKIALPTDELNERRFIAAIAVWFLTAFLGGVAIANAIRAGRRCIGRLQWAMGVGAAFGCLLAWGLLSMGAPRAALMVALLLSLSALSFGAAVRHRVTQWGLLATVPLAAMALLLGDLGAPWLKVRTDLGRRTSVRSGAWTPQAYFGVQRVSRGTPKLRIDQLSPTSMAGKLKDKQKPRFLAPDLIYSLGGKSTGPALVIGSASGRELAAALAHGHQRVDVVSFDRGLLGEILMGSYAVQAGGPLISKREVHGWVGDGVALPSALPRDYQRIVVVGTERYTQLAPRLRSDANGRLFSPAAVASFLAHLRPDGSLLMQVPSGGLPATLASVREVVGGSHQAIRERTYACRVKDGDSVLLVHGKALSSPVKHKLKKRCRQGRLTVEYPLETTAKKRRGRKAKASQSAKEREQDAKLALLESGQAPTENMPFLLSAAPLSELKAAAIESLRALAPSHVAPPPKPKKKNKRKKGAKKPTAAKTAKAKKKAVVEPPKPAPPQATEQGVLAASLVVLALLAALLFLGRSMAAGIRWALKRPAIKRPGRRLQWSMTWFGMGVALGSLFLVDRLLLMLGDRGAAWSLVLPALFAGIGVAGLSVDALSNKLARRGTVLTAVLAALLLLLFASQLSTLSVWITAGTVSGLLGAGLAAFVFGGLVGLPLAVAMRSIGDDDAMPAAVASTWASHRVGWAFGGGAGLLLLPHIGLSGLAWMAVAALLVGAALFAAGIKPTGSSETDGGDEPSLPLGAS